MPSDPLVEIGSSWGHFPWFYQEALRRSYKVGASASGDEHRGRCGGGVPGTAVFGVKGGLTGILAAELTKPAINQALRSRHTWATTGERSVALLWSGSHIQGDEFTATAPVTVHYRLLGITGWDEIAAYTQDGLLWHRNLQAEAGYADHRIRIRWGGARIKDRYRAAQWHGRLTCTRTTVQGYRTYGLEHPEEYVRRDGPLALEFRSDTFGDTDSLELDLSDLAQAQFHLHLQLDSYSKVGSPLQRHPYIHCPEFDWEFSGQELLDQGNLRQELGGAELFVAVDRLTAQPLPTEVSGAFILQPPATPTGTVPVYLTGRQIDDAKVWTSPLFVTWNQ